MNNERDMNCIVCPNSCCLKVIFNDKEVLEVSGALCQRGVEYAKSEIINPVRNLITTVRVKGGVLPLVSVRSDSLIPKSKLLQAVKALQDIEIEAPIAFHQVIFENILDTGANIIATKEVKHI